MKKMNRLPDSERPSGLDLEVLCYAYIRDRARAVTRIQSTRQLTPTEAHLSVGQVSRAVAPVVGEKKGAPPAVGMVLKGILIETLGLRRSERYGYPMDAAYAALGRADLQARVRRIEARITDATYAALGIPRERGE